MANDFLPFAGGVGANVLTQSAYAALAARTAGFSSGVAKSAELNKVWRQSSIMSAALAQLIADNTGLDVLDDGTTSTIVANLKTATGGRLIGVQVFTSSGTYTPTAGTKSVIVEAVGGGGAGGGAAVTAAGQYACGVGGSAGAFARGRFTSAFSGVSVTVGAAGAGASGADGGGGGTSSFGALLSSPGGPGGTVGGAGTPSGPANPAGASSAPSGGNILSARGGGGYGPTTFSSPSVALGGNGGVSFFGPGGRGADGVRGVPSAAGVCPGSGGGSAGVGPSSATAQAGSSGAAGIVIVYEYA